MASTGEADRWQRIEEIFLDALDLPTQDRVAFLDEQCDDDAMRREVDRMLRADSHDSVFLDHPVASLEEAFAPLDTPTEITARPPSTTLPLGEEMTPPAPPRNDPMLVADNLLCDRFRVVEFLAAGGMGEVYKVEDLELGGFVAVKILRPALTEDVVSMDRFRREVQLARRVTHASVCRSFDIFRHHFPDAEMRDDPLSPGSLTFLSMELLQGETLTHRLLRDGRLKPAVAFPIVQQISAGLEAAHREGIVHRDLKSSNVFLVPGEGGRQRAVITDFGLARLGSHNEGARRHSVTRSGVTLGTPAYMAPEQIKGEKISPATDIYALGVLIYEMVTGRFPFEGDDSLVTAIRRLHEDPTPPNKYVDDLEPRWEKAIMRCLERDPKQRFQSASDLAQFLAGETTGSQPTWVPPAIQPKWIGGILAAVAVAVFLAWGLRSGFGFDAARRTPQAAVESTANRTAVAVIEFQNLTGKPESAWLSTALAEMLSMELAASPTLRILSGEQVARMKLELELPETASYAEDTLRRVHRYSGADLVVEGSYFATAGNLRLNLRLKNTVTGKTLSLITAEGEESELSNLVSYTGQRLRNGLGLVTPSEAGSLTKALPADPEAARFYTRGLDKLRRFDVLGARQDFQDAVRLAPDSPRVYTALARSLTSLGRDSEAALAARRAFELADELPRREQLWVEGQLRRATGEWSAAADIFAALHKAYPDDVESGLLLARIQTTAGQGNHALMTLEGLRSLPEPVSLDARIALEEAIAADSLADYQHSYEAAQRAAELGKAQGARWLAARARWRQAHSLWRLAKLDEAEAVAREAEATLGALGDRAGQADAFNLLANIHENRGQLETSKSFYETALAKHRQLGNRAGETKVLNNLAYLMFRLDDETAAEALYGEALAIARSIDRKSDVARSLHNLAILRRRQERYDEAEELFGEALALSREIGDRGIQSTSLTNLGVLLRRRNELDQALESYLESLELSRQIGDQRGISSCLNNLGNLLGQLGRLSEAREYFEESSRLCRQLGDVRNLGRRQVNLATLDRRLGRLGPSEEHLAAAAALYDETKDTANLASLLASRAILQTARGAYGAARQDLLQAIDKRRELGQDQRVNSLKVDLAGIDVETGEVEAGLAALRDIIPALAEEGTAHSQLQANTLLVQALARSDRLIEAQETLARAQTLRQQSHDVERNLFYELAQAELELRLGRLEQAQTTLDAAQTMVEATELPLVALELRLLQGDLQAARGNTSASREIAQAVLAEAESMGHQHLVAQASRRL